MKWKIKKVLLVIYVGGQWSGWWYLVATAIGYCIYLPCGLHSNWCSSPHELLSFLGWHHSAAVISSKRELIPSASLPMSHNIFSNRKIILQEGYIIKKKKIKQHKEYENTEKIPDSRKIFIEHFTIIYLLFLIGYMHSKKISINKK